MGVRYQIILIILYNINFQFKNYLSASIFNIILKIMDSDKLNFLSDYERKFGTQNFPENLELNLWLVR